LIWFSIFATILASLSGLVAWIDLRRGIIPNALNGALLVFGFLACVTMGQPSQFDALLGVCLAGALFFAVHQLYRHLRGRDGLGLGDVKFLSAAGVWVGASGLPWLVLIASASGLVYALAVRLVSGNIDTRTRLAFGPHLALGLFLTWVSKGQGLL
jgi:leader peptidase (prepilin peptidase) / N-methyltransferase